jgi:hypothetical protein
VQPDSSLQSGKIRCLQASFNLAKRGPGERRRAHPRPDPGRRPDQVDQDDVERVARHLDGRDRHRRHAGEVSRGGVFTTVDVPTIGRPGCGREGRRREQRRRNADRDGQHGGAAGAGTLVFDIEYVTPPSGGGGGGRRGSTSLSAGRFPQT